MTKINVLTPFLLTLTDGANPLPFAVGVQEVEEHVAQHWYVQAHSEPVVAAHPQRRQSDRPQAESQEPAPPAVGASTRKKKSK